MLTGLRAPTFQGDKEAHDVATPSGSTSKIIQRTAIIQEDCNPIATNMSSKKVFQKRWKCDVCHIKWFLDFKEACDHEAQCTGPPPAMIDESSQEVVSQSNGFKGSLVIESSAASAPMTSVSDEVVIDLGSSDDDAETPSMKSLLTGPSKGSKSVKSSTKVDEDHTILMKNKRLEGSGSNHGQSFDFPIDKASNSAMSSENFTANSKLRRSTRSREAVQPKCQPLEDGKWDEKHKKSIVLKSEKTESSKLRKGGQVNSFFLPKKLPKKQTTKPSQGHIHESLHLSQEEVESHLAAEEFFARRKRGSSSEGLDETKQKGWVERKASDIVYIDSSTVDGVNPKKRNIASKDEKAKKELPDEVVAEHHAANFFARRKTAVAEERERQQKRDEQKRARMTEKSCNIWDDSAVLDTRVSDSSCPQIMPSVSQFGASSIKFSDAKEGTMNYLFFVKFPSPSHVFSTQDSRSENVNSYMNIDALRQTPRFPHLVPSLLENDEISMNPIFCPKTDDTSVLEHDLFNDILLDSFEPPSNQSKITDLDNKLWTDKYSMKRIPDDLLGDRNKKSAKLFIDFIEDWKIRRHKAMVAMAEQARSKQRRKKRKKIGSCGYDSDDSFLNDGGLEKVFLIRGPTASGKTNLVHAVAKQCGCTVMEIHSGEARGGQDLKRVLQESSQCHSSVALMKLGKTTLFEANMCGRDYHDCMNDDSDCEDDSSEGRLTVVLLDEVDLLFDGENSGFWTALAQLSQKAKCPIVLTSTCVPSELDSANIRYKEIHLQKPTINECCVKIRRVAESEGFRLRNADDGSCAFATVAETFQCDLRRIINEMQLFKYDGKRLTPKKIVDVSPLANPNPPSFCSQERPVIFELKPKIVSRDRNSVFQILGKNFANAKSLELFVGEKFFCHYRVLSSEEILAVCPPCSFPEGVTNTAKYENSMISCLSHKFPAVFIRKSCTNGLVLDSNPYCLEYDIPLEEALFEESRMTLKSIQNARAEKRRRKLSSEGAVSSDSEEEFEKTAPLELSKPLTNLKKIHHDSNSLDLGVANRPATLLDEELRKRNLQYISNSESSNDIISFSDLCSDNSEFGCFAEEMGLLSDVAMIEDSFIHFNTPFLSGAVEGLGFNSVESRESTDDSIDKLCKGKNLRPPSFESLYLRGENISGFFFGCSDAHMTYPNRRRERYLMKCSQLYSRGRGQLECCRPEGILDENPTTNLDDDVDLFFFRPLSRAASQDDSFHSQQVSSSLLLLPSLLSKELHFTEAHGFTLKVPQLHSRAIRRSMEALRLIDTVLDDEKYRFFISLRHRSNFYDEFSQRCLIWVGEQLLDKSIATDYLPYLRSIAFHERIACDNANKILNHDENVSTKRKSRKRKENPRPHYFQEFLTKYRKDQLEYVSCGLAKMHLSSLTPRQNSSNE